MQPCPILEIINNTSLRKIFMINSSQVNFCVRYSRGSPNIEMDEHTFLINRERAVDYLNSLEKVPSPLHIFLYLHIYSSQLIIMSLVFFLSVFF